MTLDANTPRASAQPPCDVHSYARPAEARVTHVSLRLTADFDTRELRGSAALDLAVAPGAAEVVLDTRDLTIHGVADTRGRPLPFTLGPPDPVLGQPLRVALPPGTTHVVVTYATSPAAAALQWCVPPSVCGGSNHCSAAAAGLVA